MNISRRTALGFLADAAVPSAAVAGVSLATAKPADTLPSPERAPEEAVKALEAAMTAIHGEGVSILRNGNHCICVTEPASADRRIHWSWSVRGRRPENMSDHVRRAGPSVRPSRQRPRLQGSPEPKQLGTRYYYEHHLRRSS
jgi:hypothetical protein